MQDYKPGFIKFSVIEMEKRGAKIQKWAQSDNPLLAQTCREILEASKLAKAL